MPPSWLAECVVCMSVIYLSRSKHSFSPSCDSRPFSLNKLHSIRPCFEHTLLAHEPSCYALRVRFISRHTRRVTRYHDNKQLKSIDVHFDFRYKLANRLCPDVLGYNRCTVPRSCATHSVCPTGGYHTSPCDRLKACRTVPKSVANVPWLALHRSLGPATTVV